MRAAAQHTFSVDSLPNSVLAGLKWKSEVFTFVLPGPSVIKLRTCSQVPILSTQSLVMLWASYTTALASLN